MLLVGLVYFPQPAVGGMVLVWLFLDRVTSLALFEISLLLF